MDYLQADFNTLITNMLIQIRLFIYLFIYLLYPAELFPFDL